MSAGLLASTVTPGSTAPEVSLTTPAITACARAPVGMRIINATIASAFTLTRICHLSVDCSAPLERPADSQPGNALLHRCQHAAEACSGQVVRAEDRRRVVDVEHVQQALELSLPYREALGDPQVQQLDDGIEEGALWSADIQPIQAVQG